MMSHESPVDAGPPNCANDQDSSVDHDSEGETSESDQAVNAELTPYSELITILERLDFLLRETRRREGLSLRHVARLTGIPFNSIRRFEAHGVPDAVLTVLRFVGSHRTSGS
jgi:hypothetical protein